MNTELAKKILQAHPPGGDDSDPRLRAALEFAASNPELLSWFSEQQALDRSIQQKVKTVRPPPDLLDEIVAGWKQQTRRDARQRTLWPKYAALAAAFVLLAGVAAIAWSWFASGESPQMTRLRMDMAAFLKEFPQLDAYMERQSEVRQWLGQRQTFAAAEIPARLQGFPAIGCREIEWQGRRIALICFMTDGEIVHLFLIPGTPSPAPSRSKPQLARAGHFATATWTQGDLIYMVMTPASRKFLEKLL